MPVPLLIAGGAAALGGGIASATADKPTVDRGFTVAPEYPHSQDARDLWWNKLQGWGSDPNYGAISPDWNNIWDTVQNRVKQYYQGDALNPGVKGRIDSSLARRGMSDNPASDFLKARVDAEQGGQLKDLGAQQAVAQAQFAENGRQNWLNSLQNFQAQKPVTHAYEDINDPGATQRGIGQAISGVGTAVAGYGVNNMAQQSQQDWLSGLINQKQNDSMYGYEPFFN